MLQAFVDHVFSKNLLRKEGRYLLACSGGQDSIALAHLLFDAGIQMEIAHVNFQLRGRESDEDQVFVRNWALSRQVLFHTLSADTILEASQNGISIQMAAREIRYAFFEKIRSDRQLDGIILAHHEDDQIETLLLNLTRGTGIDGLAGMADRNGWLIRPLLPFPKAQIVNYLTKHELIWREDQSNAESYYKRNYLRHQVIPALLQSEPIARQNILNSMERFRETGKALSGLVKDWIDRHVCHENEFQVLDLKVIRHQTGISTLLFYWLRPYGFNATQTSEITQKLSNYRIGTAFYSSDFQLIFDRDCLILGNKPSPFNPITILPETNTLATPRGQYTIAQVSWPAPLDRAYDNAMLDLETLDFPLQIRTWQKGDRFVPLGMQSEKKISDFLIDQKISLIEKETVLVVESGRRIAWVIGYRIADWAKCSASTRICLHFKKS